ncbi:MAG: hypothetical protein FWF75_07015, partial [Propionibacteriaceae bacterium]|nr:hypothetical protein [Propionibacteriaceae bacterium]
YDHAAFCATTRLLQIRAEHPDIDDAEAIRQVRRWMRGIDTDALQAWLADLDREVELPTTVKDAFTGWLDRCAAKHPFEDPMDWAPFCYIGW